MPSRWAAYHGGALAALLVAAQHSDGQLIIDAMATASAGALTGVLAARALLRGADPVGLMTKAWVEADSLGALRSHDTESVLDPEPLRLLAADLLTATGSVPDGEPATRPPKRRGPPLDGPGQPRGPGLPARFVT